MKIIRALSLVVAVLFLVLALLTPTFGNVWALATGRGFFIPTESSMFTFRVTEENHGSGEWWLYGEDAHNFFALHPDEPRYLIQSRISAAQCTGFLPQNQVTWCSPRDATTP